MNKCKNGVLFRTQKIPYCSWQMRNWRLMRSVYIDIPQVDLHNYVMEVMSAPGTVWTKNYYTNIDIKSDLVNVFNGMRRTVGNAYDKPVQRILMYGDSRMYGTGVEDKDTLPSQLQLLLDDHDMQIEVLNMGVRSDVLTNIYERIINSTFKQDDILVLFIPVFSNYSAEFKICSRNYYYALLKFIINEILSKNIKLIVFKYPDIRIKKHLTTLEKFLQHSVSTNKKYSLRCPEFFYDYDKLPVKFIDTQNALQTIPSKASAFWDYFHFGPVGNSSIAKYIFPYLKSSINDENEIIINHPVISSYELDIAKKEIDKFKLDCSYEYLLQEEKGIKLAREYYHKYPKFQLKNNENVGAIVMNCNPFSNGHLYLINTALSMVDYLYIFIVNEDKSIFSFDHRLFMVRKYFANNKNILVLPSGNLMISSLTFPEYFNKDFCSNQQIDTSLDISFFGNIIAKIFNINTRFVGNEPFCSVTKQYNEMMKKELPYYGIDVHEIKRKTDESGLPISASNIRQCIKNKDFTKLKELVPNITYDLIINYYSQP